MDKPEIQYPGILELPDLYDELEALFEDLNDYELVLHELKKYKKDRNWRVHIKLSIACLMFEMRTELAPYLWCWVNTGALSVPILTLILFLIDNEFDDKIEQIQKEEYLIHNVFSKEKMLNKNLIKSLDYIRSKKGEANKTEIEKDRIFHLLDNWLNKLVQLKLIDGKGGNVLRLQ